MQGRGPIDWTEPGVLTAIDADVVASVEALPSDPLELCRIAQGLVLLPNLAADLPDARQDERNLRSASDLLRTLAELGPADLTAERPLDRRVVGTCRHFALLSTALLRHHGHAARARCGFAGYFVPNRFVDHWVTEYLDDAARWVRIDSEILGFDFVDQPHDLRPGQFLTGGEAWTTVAAGAADPMHFGVDGVPDNWGIGEIRGNAMRDLASLNKVEMLPWDEWGRMAESYRGETGPDFDRLIDDVATACASDDEPLIERTYQRADLAVPTSLLH
jgi:hypothetical protein